MADAAPRSSKSLIRAKQLGQLLLENRDVKSEQIEQALKNQKENGGLIGQILQQNGACKQDAVTAALIRQSQVTEVIVEDLKVPAAVMELVSRETCVAEKLCPFERLGNLLCIVMDDPQNRKPLLALEIKHQVKVKSFKASWQKIGELIAKSYGASPLESASAPTVSKTLSTGAPLTRTDQVAKINVNLDVLDFSRGEVVAEADVTTVPLALVPDGYFYPGGMPPHGERAKELVLLIRSLPVAEVLAQTLTAYVIERKKESTRMKVAPRFSSALHAVKLSEEDFRKQRGGLSEDPVGEWNWRYSAPGPLPAMVFEEN